MDAGVVARGARIRVRAATGEDLDFVMAAERAPENARNVSLWERARHAGAIADEGMAHWIVETEPAGEPVGYVLLGGIGGEDRSVELKRLVITRKRRGYGRAVLRLVQDYAFATLGAHRLWLDVFHTNPDARRLYESEGFVVEGTLRECVRRGDGYISLIVLSMLEDEYRERARGHGLRSEVRRESGEEAGGFVRDPAPGGS